MKILAIDTSGPNCSISILEDDKLIADFTVNNGTTHSQNLVPMIEQVQSFSNVDLADIDTFACSIGPGSFTGLRIGLATIKGFALSLNKKVICVPTLLALAYNVSHFDGIICSILDARNDNVYAGLYKNENGKPVLITDYVADHIDVLIQTIKTQQFSSPILFVGDGVNVYKEKLVAELNNLSKNSDSELDNNLNSINKDSETLLFASNHQNNQYALSVARAALDMAKQNEYSDYNTLSPLYLKKSQAERMLDNPNN